MLAVRILAQELLPKNEASDNPKIESPSTPNNSSAVLFITLTSFFEFKTIMASLTFLTISVE